ncbi:MAG: phosphate ABC transporter substrate-binding protein [Deltaproteobacteria bacterium]|nr:phosphate ABC transporter substrate-binding protein [Deltaproteobacteria bacterium]
MKTKYFLNLLVLTMVLFVSMLACSRSQKQNVTLAGSTAFQPFAEKLAEIYMASHPEISINVQGGGSAVGIQSAVAGNADIGMADLLTLPDEAKLLTSTIVARDGIALIVNPKNTLVALTAQQARDIFSGQITNWKDVGGSDAAIRVFSREDGSGTRRSFDKLVLGTLKVSSSALFQNSNGTIREAVANDPGAIGYLSIGLVNSHVKALTYNGVAPTNSNVKKGIYPLARPIFFLTKENLKPDAKIFVDYVLSAESQKTLEEEGLISAK